eukprot:GFUD01064123.1.p1 GENE.GFUD01064123.1~~GFUD01064123.1.p1  ORF type:complete len:560 (+),score=125.62 GFUD01064123.1:420-2099(+)
MSFTQVLLCMRKSIEEEHPYTSELQEPLKRPDDVIEAIERSKQTGDHSEIHNILKDRNINLRTAIEEEIDGVNKKRTIARKLLEDAVNGNKIVKRELDIHVKATDDKEDSINYALEIDFEGILSEESPKQTMVLYDLLDLRVEKRSEHNEAFTNLIKHPVIASFIALKWKKTKWYFYTTSLIFMSFLLFYSAFIIYIFNRPEVYCSKLEKLLSEKNSKGILFPEDNSGTKQEINECERHQARISKKFLADFDDNFIVCEVLFLIFFIFLSAMEIYQAIKLKRQYFKELENYIEWVVLISALITMMFKEIILQSNWEAAVIRGIAAVGICAAWLELIFIIGRYPFRGGDFSIMFYNIIKKLVRYVIAMFLMIIGFAFAFMVVNYGHNQDSFENPIKSTMMTLTMALGEFNFEDMYNTFKEDSTSRGFAMVLLVLLILFGTITMVNLFIAVIISDISQLREDVYTQNLINMAQCSILVEELLPSCILNKMRVEDKMVVCMHSLCPKGCSGTKLSPHLKPVVDQLNEIAKLNSEEQDRTKSHKGKGSSIQTQAAILISGRTF